MQKRLVELKFFDGNCDGNFTATTKEAVKAFQISKGLNADGVVGPVTWGALEIEKPQQSDSVPVPQSRNECYKLFGDPLLSGYWKEYSGFCETPVELNHCFTYKNSEGKHGFYCNKLLIPKFQAVHKAIVTAGLSQELKTFDGCYNVRKIRGGSELSTHSWGIAVDHNAAENALGAEPKISKEIVAIFENHGFYWGGRFKRKDGMHFQYGKNF